MNTGHAIVDQITMMRFEGIKIDHRWLGHPLLCKLEGKRVKEGKSTGFWFDAAYVLAEILYFYAAKVERDPEGHIVSVTKRFDGDVMYQDYEVWGRKLGLTKYQLQDIIAFLKQKGLIRAWAEPVILRNGTKTNNLPHFEPVPAKIRELTYGSSSPKPKPPKPTPKLAEDEGPEDDGELQETDDQPEFEGEIDEEIEPETVENEHEIEPEEGLENNSRGVSKFGEAPRKNFKPIQKSASVSPELEGGVSKNTETITRYKSSSTPRQVLNITSRQQQKGANAPVADFSKFENELFSRITAFETGLCSKVIRKAIALHPEHVEMWAEYWLLQPESRNSFWIGRNGSPAGALRQRLENPNELPPQVRAERAAAECTAADRERHELAAARRRSIEFEEKAAAHSVFKRYQALPRAKRLDVRDTVKKNCQFLVERAPDHDIEKIKPGHALFVTYAKSLEVAMLEVESNAPKLPGMAQRAAGEIDDFEDDFEEVEMTPELAAIHAQIEAEQSALDGDAPAIPTNPRELDALMGCLSASQIDAVHRRALAMVRETGLPVQPGTEPFRSIERKALRELLQDGTIPLLPLMKLIKRQEAA